MFTSTSPVAGASATEHTQGPFFVCAHLPVGVLAVSHRPIGLAMSSEGFDIMTYEEAQQLVIAPIVP
jgi:hypothetical protein